MIVRRRHTWFRMLFIWNGSVLPVIVPRLLLVFVISAAIVVVKGQLFDVKIPLSPVPFSLAGIALAIFLGFRNTAGYDRFWEGRKLWGSLLNDSRTLMRQLATNVDAAPTALNDARLLIIALVYSLKHQLRMTEPAHDLRRLLPDSIRKRVEAKKYKPAFLLRLLGEWIREARLRKEIPEGALYGLDLSLAHLSDDIGGCERIASTPIPYPYTVLLHRTVYIYCFFLPFGLVDSIGWATPFFSVFISYTLMALDEVVNQIEDPFGDDDNDLALDAMSEMIEISICEMADVTAPALTAQPQNYRLM